MANKIKVSENIARAIESAGWEITADPWAESAGNSVVVSLPIKTLGFGGEDYNDVIYYDGTDMGFAESVRAIGLSFDSEEYDEENEEAGKCIQAALDDLADAMDAGVSAV